MTTTPVLHRSCGRRGSFFVLILPRTYCGPVSRFVLVCILLLAFAACSSTGQTGFPTCRETTFGPDGRPRITVFFATDRAETKEPGAVFGFRRADNVTYGKAVVSLPPDNDREFGTTLGLRMLSTTIIGDDRAFAEALRAAAKMERVRSGNSQSLVFVHGYNESFDRVVFRIAQMTHDGCLGVVPIVFAWPSRDFFLDYDYDLDSATFAKWDVARVLRIVRDLSGFDVTHVMAHSLGNWTTLEGLGLMSLEPIDSKDGVQRKFGAMLLASPDMDLDVFRREVPTAMSISDRVVLLVSEHDVLLGISGFLAHGPSRVGAATTEELVSHRIQPVGNFSIIRMDGPEIGNCPAGSHRCAESSPKILNEINLVLKTTSKPLPSANERTVVPSGY
jgi:esterase/lipase superfamily enzyme